MPPQLCHPPLEQLDPSPGTYNLSLARRDSNFYWFASTCSAWQVLCSETVSNTYPAALADCTSVPAVVGGPKEAPNAKHMALTRTIPKSEDSCIHLITLLSKYECSSPSPHSPAAQNAGDPATGDPGSSGTPSLHTRPPNVAPYLGPGHATGRSPTRQRALCTGRLATATRR